MKEGMILVVSAPSGSGKTSVLHRVFKRYPELQFSVSATTREPRQGERDGIDYYFVSDKEFDSKIQNDEFAEWAEVYGHRYGTLKSTLDDAVDAGSIIVLDTDVVGALNVKKIRPHAVLAFLAPPSLDVLRSRLENRNTETSERLKKRLDAAPGEMAKMYEYDYIIVNDKLDDAVDAMSAIIEAERHRSFRVEYNGI